MKFTLLAALFTVATLSLGQGTKTSNETAILAGSLVDTDLIRVARPSPAANYKLGFGELRAWINAATLPLGGRTITGTLPAANGGTGKTSLGASVADWMETPTSANLALALSDENGSGKAIFADGTLAITAGKTFTASNTLTLSGTDGSTLAIGSGGTLGTAAFTASSAYEVPLTFGGGLSRSTNTITVNAINLATSGSGGVTGTLPVANGGTGVTTFGSGVAAALPNPVNASAGLLTYGIIGTSGAAVPLLNSAVTFSGGVTVTSNNLTVGNSGAVAGTGRAIYVGDYVSSAGGQAQIVGNRPGSYYWGMGHPSGASATYIKMGGCSSIAGAWASDANFGLWIDGGLALGALDCVAYRDAASVWQMGADAATATAQTMKSADGLGTDKAGADFVFAAGAGTGTQKGGALYFKTAIQGSTSGATLNAYQTRRVDTAKPVALVEGSDTTVLNIALPSGKYFGATIAITVYATDGTDTQSITTIAVVDAVNKAGTITATVTPTQNTAAVSTGTLTATVTAAGIASTSVNIKINATSSLSQTTLSAMLSATAINSNVTDTTINSGSLATPQ